MAAERGGIYQRGGLWLEYDRGRGGKQRSPNLYVWRYDPAKRRAIGTSTGTADVEQAKSFLDAQYSAESRGAAVCHACGQTIHTGQGFLLMDAITNYIHEVGNKRASAEAINARLTHVVNYVATLKNAAVTCDEIDARWIERFREWMAARPIVGSRGKTRARAAGTIENSVVQLAAAINHAHERRDVLHGARFKPLQPSTVNVTPQWRASVEDMARMLEWTINRGKRGEALHRFLIFSIGTLGRPDAALDFTTNPAREQWVSDAGIIRLNPKGRKQTRKYRATVKCPERLRPWLDATAGQFVRNSREAVSSIRSPWDSMRTALNLPEGEDGAPKCIRRSMSTLLRARRCPVDQFEMQMGHRVLKAITETYAPFDPEYLGDALTHIEAIMNEIEALVPNAFTGIAPEKHN